MNSFFSYFEFRIRQLIIKLGFLSKNKNFCFWTHNLLILNQELQPLHETANCQWETPKRLQ